MSNDQKPEQLVRLSQAIDIIERITGERPDLSTIYRWTTVGIRGPAYSIRWTKQIHTHHTLSGRT